MSQNGVETDPDKIEALSSWHETNNVKELRSFLGFTGYYRRFIKDYARIVKPLNDLLIGYPTHSSADQKKKKKKKIIMPWQWGPAQQTAFDTIKQKLSSSPVLSYADFAKPFVVHTDASLDGLGAVLYQEQNGMERVIAYASRGLRNSEKLYPAHKLEFLCLKWAVTEKFRDYLYGNTFTVCTDNNPLTYVLISAKLDATGHRWLASLGTYNFQLKYKSGNTNGIRIQFYIAACWTGSSSIKSPADEDPVLYNIQCYITKCWPGSSGIKSPADQNPVLYNSMLVRFF